jgi:hypothetical protein
MKIHGLVCLRACAVLHEAAAAAFDLDPTTCLLLDVLDISAAMANHLSSKIEARNRFHVDWYTLFRPFALQVPISPACVVRIQDTYSTKFITFELFWFATPESAFVDQIGQFLLHKLFDFSNGFF